MVFNQIVAQSTILFKKRRHKLYKFIYMFFCFVFYSNHSGSAGVKNAKGCPLLV